jgi:hypothetical protein
VGERREGREGFSTAKLSTQLIQKKRGNLRFFHEASMDFFDGLY